MPLAFGSAPWARRSSIAATWPLSATKWKAVMPRCEGTRKGMRHGRCGEQHTRAKHRRSRLGVNSVGSGRCAQQLGHCCKLLCPVLKSRAESRWCGHVAVTQMPWCSNAMKLGKQHHASALSRSHVSHLERHGSLFKFNVIVCVVARAGLVRAAHAFLYS